MSALAENRGRDFWSEAKHARGYSSACSNVVDSLTALEEVASLFASEYQDLELGRKKICAL